MSNAGSTNLHELDIEPTHSIRDIFSILYEWRYFIFMFTLIAAVASIVALSGRERDYEARTAILIDPRGIEILERDITPRARTTDGNIAIVEGQMRIMKSDNVLKEVVKRENLTSDFEFNGRKPSLLGNLRSLFSGPGKPVSKEVIALFRLKKAIGVSRPKLGYVVELRVKTKQPQKSARIANTITGVYLQSETVARSNVTQRAADALRARLEELRNQLTTSENAVENYKLKNNILSSSGGLINEQELNQVNVALVEARNSTSAAKVVLEEIAKLKKSGRLPQTLPGAIESQTISSLRIQLSQASQRKISLSARYLETHPVMIAEELRLKDIRKSIFEELDRIASAAELEFNSARGQEKELQAKVTNLSNRTYSTNDAKVKLRELQREADSKRVVYEAFLVRAKELGGQAGINTSDARIISPASPPLQPSGLSSMVLLAGGTIVGFGLGSVLALLGASISPQLPRSERPSTVHPGIQKTKPSAPKLSQNLLGRFFATKPQTGIANDLHPPGNSQALRLPVLAALAIPRNNLIADQVPFLVRTGDAGRTNDDISAVAEKISLASTGKTARTILVTGIEDGFGKSTFVCNLAYAAAMRGENVMLIGADQDCANAVQVFSSVAELELENAAGYKIAVGEGALGQSAFGNFQFWPMRQSANTGRLHNMAQLKRLKDRLDDPVFATGLALVDGPLLDGRAGIEAFANLADEVIVVLPKGGSPGAEVHKLLSTLGKQRSRIRGVVTVAYVS